MADVNPMSLINAALAGLSAETKARSDSDDMLGGSSRSGANFTDMMMARVTARQQSSSELDDIQSNYADASRPDDTRPGWVDQLKNAEAADRPVDRMRRPDRPERRDDAVAVRAKDKPSDTIDTAKSAAPASDAHETSDWADDGSVDTMKKVAATLLQAEKDGKLTLPPEVKALLQKINALGDASPADVMPLAQNILTALRKLEDGTSADQLAKPMGEMTWPEAVVDMFKDLQVNPGVKAGKAIDLGKVIKALRMLAHLAIKNATAAAAQSGATVTDPALLAVPVKHGKDKEKSGVLGGVESEETIALGSAKKSPKPEDVIIGASESIIIDPATKLKSSIVSSSADKPAVTAFDDAGARSKIAAAWGKGAEQHDKPASSDGSGAALAGAAGVAGKADKNAAGSFMDKMALQNDTPALTPMATALSARSSFVAQASAPSATQSTVPHSATQQIVVSLQKGPITKDTQLSIQLNPAELGRVEVKITIDATGKASAQIIAERADTLMLLQKDSSHLEKALQNAGLNNSAQDLHYSLKEQNGQQRGNEFAGKRRRLFDNDEDAQKIALDTPISADGLPHRVNYHA